MFIVIFGLYVYCLPHTVLGGDSADILIAIATHSNAHPSGYPTYVLLGILFSFIPFIQSLVIKVGVLSALLSSASILLVYLLIHKQTSSLFVALVSSSTLAFVYPFWLYAESSDVFALHFFLSLVLVFLAFSLRVTRKKFLFFPLAFFLGLSLTNNLTILLVYPSVFLLVYSKKVLSLLTIKTVGICSLLFLLGLTPYLYLFYGSHNTIIYNWESVESVSGFFNYILRKQYGWGISTQNQIDSVTRVLTVKSFATYWMHNISVWYFLLSFVGVISMMRRDKSLAVAFLVGVFFTGFFFVIYSGNDLSDAFRVGTLERFYVLPFILTIPFFAEGMIFLRSVAVRFLKKVHSIKNSLPFIMILLQGLFLYIPIALFVFNFPRAYLRNIDIGEVFMRDILSELPKNSILFFRSDTVLFNAGYLQTQYGLRNDVYLGTVVSVDHLIQTDSRYGTVAASIKKKNPKIFQNDLYLSTIFEQRKIKPVFSNEPFGAGKVTAKDWVPYGLVYKLKMPGENLTKNEFIKQQDDLFAKMSLLKVKSAIFAENTPLLMLEIPSNYTRGFLYTGDYLVSEYHDYKTAQIYYQKAYELNPYELDPLKSMIMSHVMLGECQEAELLVHKLVELNGDKAKLFQIAVKDPKICKPHR